MFVQLIKLIGSSLNYKSEATNPDEEDRITLMHEHSVKADLTFFLYKMLPKSHPLSYSSPPQKKERKKERETSINISTSQIIYKSGFPVNFCTHFAFRIWDISSPLHGHESPTPLLTCTRHQNSLRVLFRAATFFCKCDSKLTKLHTFMQVVPL